MHDNIQKKDYIWSYIGYIADISVYAVLTPFLTVLLTPFELGLWYTFMGFYSFVNLFDSGVSPIIMRNASYCIAGAKNFVKEGIPELSKQQTPNYYLLTALYKTNRKLLCGISLFIYTIGLFGGIPYIRYITRMAFESRYILAWVIFLTGIVFNVYFIAIPSFLKGIGAIASGQKAIAISRIVQLSVCIISVSMGYGIIGLSLGILVGAICIGVISLYYCRKHFKPHYKKNIDISCKEILKIIWYNSWRLLLMAIGGYFISQANTILCSTFLSLESTASYGLTIQAIQAVGIIAFVYMQTSIPEISKAQITHDIFRQKQLVGTSSTVFLILDILGNIAVILLANPILQLINAKTLLLPTGMIAIVAITNLLEKHTNLYSQFIVCTNRVPFVKASIISGILVVIISYIILTFTNIGVMGLLFSQMFVQLAYNNWRWPYMGCRILKTNLLELNQIGLKNLQYIIKKSAKT